ncbi:MAG: phytanoyl-CoA dioxygenase, partial [Porticoccaceae bacterium]
MKQDISRSIEACAAHYGDDAEAMRNYLTEGERSAYKLDNRGAIRFDKQGNLAADILSAYSKYGFYVFENVLAEDELQDIKEDLDQIRESYPSEPNGKLTKEGKPALGADCLGPNLVWSKPLGDPLGGTELANGRHQVKLFEPEASASAPEFAPFILLGSLQFSESCLRVYGHPQLLRVAEAVN